MELKAILFSESHRDRVARHVAFWIAWLFLAFATSSAGMHFDNPGEALLFDLLVTLQTNWLTIPFCYLIVSFIVPKYFETKHYAIGIFFLLLSVSAYLVMSYINQRLTSYFIISRIMHRNPMGDFAAKFFAVRGLIEPLGPLVCCAIIGSFRFLSFWYIKQQENITLQRENTVAELQLLKAQVHPHFLFNTLNNIYSFTLSGSPVAADLVEKLSGILHYMIQEGEKSAVPLRREIDLVLDYISLEKVRYGKRLNITVSVHGDPGSMTVAPLLMIPFVENAFKHGSSQLLHNPVIHLTITSSKNELQLEVINNKPTTQSEPPGGTTRGGIGLRNVKKRLQLLYPNRHTLRIDAGETTFSIRMNIVLGQLTNEKTNIQPIGTLSYANP